ncbi:hypothetical protein SBOR_4258 [Sclerotinia borealis F-4128]|uniref:Uncharacterized protein n=1 Tax=Sclerotinia borealis (strain F-4128) TaxID=1432307 RepID=W9CF90_SCLBF|nr:hypothetical protein SBOR_4258 [Sclerotinia borealis F-4128]
MDSPPHHPKVIRRVDGMQRLRVGTSISRASLLATLQNSPHTGRMVVMKRNIMRKIPSPIRTALMTLRGGTTIKIRRMISEPFNVVKFVDGEPVLMHRYHELVMDPRDPCIPLSELQAINERFPMTMSPSRGRGSAGTPTHTVAAQAPAALESATAAPVLCLQRSSPRHLTINAPDLSSTTVDGKTVDPSTQPHRPIRPPPASSSETSRAWRTHAENARKSYMKLSRAVDTIFQEKQQLEDRNRQLEEELQTQRAAASQQRAFLSHFKMMLERESMKVELLEKKLENAAEVAAATEASKANNVKRSSSQRTAESTESWSYSDEAKFHAVKFPIPFPPPSPTVSMIPSGNSSISTAETDDRKGWVTATKILTGSGSEDQSDHEGSKDSENHQPEPASPIELPTELPTEPTTPATHPAFTIRTTLNHINFNSSIDSRITRHPAFFRIPISPIQETLASACVDWCLELFGWEWCSVPDLKLVDPFAGEKRRRRGFGRVFQGRELVDLRLSGLRGEREEEE